MQSRPSIVSTGSVAAKPPSVKVVSPEDREAVASSELVCSVLNDIFKIIGDSSPIPASSSFSYKQSIRNALTHFYAVESIDITDQSTDSIDKRFLLQYLLGLKSAPLVSGGGQSGHSNSNSIALTLTEQRIETVLKQLETENKIFVDENTIYQI